MLGINKSVIIKVSSVLITDGAIIGYDNKLYLISFSVQLQWCSLKKYYLFHWWIGHYNIGSGKF